MSTKIDSQDCHDKIEVEATHGHGVGNRSQYYGKWDSFAKKSEEELNKEEEEAKRIEKERVANIPDSEADRRDREKREALKEAKKQWDNVEANEKSKEIFFENDNDVTDRVIDTEAMSGKRVIYLKGNVNSSYIFPKDLSVTKIFIESCNHCTLKLHCKISTSCIEISRCESLKVNILTQPVHTIQVDMSDDVAVHYARDLFTPDTKVYHSSVRSMKISYDWKGSGVEAGYKSQTIDDFELSQLAMQSRSASDAGKDDQFVTSYLLEERELVTDLVLRDGSGHPTTSREVEARKRAVEEEARKRGLDVNAPEIQKYLHEYDPLSPLELGKKYKDEGNRAFKEADYRQASVHYTQAVDTIQVLSLSDNPEAAEVMKAALSNRAACSLKLGEHTIALEDASACLQLDPQHVKATFRKGMALHALQRYREACPVLSRALAMEPKNAQIKAALTFAERKAMLVGSK